MSFDMLSYMPSSPTQDYAQNTYHVSNIATFDIFQDAPRTLPISIFTICLSCAYLDIILHYGHDPPAKPKQRPANAILHQRQNGSNPLRYGASDVGLRLPLQSPL